MLKPLHHTPRSGIVHNQYRHPIPALVSVCEVFLREGVLERGSVVVQGPDTQPGYDVV